MKTAKELRPAPYNPRKISDQQYAALGKALLEFGDLGCIVFNRRTNHVVGGHQRLKHIDPEWPVKADEHKDNTGTVAVGHIDTPWGRMGYREVDWPEKKEIAANIAANKISGDWDIPKLKELLVGLDDGSGLLDLTGFDPSELEDLIDKEIAEQPPEVKFSEELGEENNYIVLYFKTTTDWTQALSLLELETRYSKRKNGKPWSTGIGRVVHGPEAISSIRKNLSGT